MALKVLLRRVLLWPSASAEQDAGVLLFARPARARREALQRREPLLLRSLREQQRARARSPAILRSPAQAKSRRCARSTTSLRYKAHRPRPATRRTPAPEPRCVLLGR